MLNLRTYAEQKHGEEFLKQVDKIAASLKIPSAWLLAVMYFESGINPQASNFNSNQTYDTGVIQFNDVTAEYLGTSRAALLGMTALQQLYFVEKYYTLRKGKYKRFGHLYLFNLSVVLFDNPNDPRSIEFIQEVEAKYKSLTGLSPNPEQQQKQLINIAISLLVLLVILYLFSKSQKFKMNLSK